MRRAAAPVGCVKSPVMTSPSPRVKEPSESSRRPLSGSIFSSISLGPWQQLSQREKKEKGMVQSFPQRRRTARPLLSESGMRPVLRQAQQPGTASATAAAVLPSQGGQTLSPHVAAGPSRYPELELAPAWFRAVESAFLISVRSQG